ncbi:hypothetical protein NK718_11505 [Alsobacter sp. SYSU M60028]|uniref:Uncharacterized protein n=1 Tax=Alsobacter ponti TaxID=2962936 RepID=A0ABT1LE20_9HYPH|nr:hypothetical protein [Alsobacter ponti]MCP8939143.1 hypothetical protein [Alsobacter ponti]
MFRSLSRLMLVKDVEDLAYQIAFGMVANALRDGHKLDAGFAETTDIEF